MCRWLTKICCDSLLILGYGRYIQYKFEDTELAIRSRTLRKGKHTITKRKCTKKAISDLQTTTLQTKESATRT